MRSYYDYLGVRRTATSQEIRTAYLRLMKRHHPDLVSCDNVATGSASLINECYAVLSDPVKRAQYDAELRAPPQLHTAPSSARRAAPIGRLRWGPAVAIAVSAVSIGTVGLSAEWNSGMFENGAPQWIRGSSSQVAASAVHLPDLVVSQRMADRARTLSVHDAEHFSRECFASANVEQNASNADACVLFDVAFLYWQKTPSAVSAFPAYFADGVVSDRHHETMMPHGAAARRRLFNLREIAYHALLRGMAASGPLLSTSPEKGDKALPKELRDGEKERLAMANVSLRDKGGTVGSRKH